MGRVVTEKGAFDLAQPFVNKVGVTAVHWPRKSDNLGVARTYRAPIANRTEEITEEDSEAGAGLFKARKLGDEYFASFEQCKGLKTCTIPLRGASKDSPKKVERAKAEAEAAKKGEDKDGEDLDDSDEEEEEDIREDADEEAEPKQVKPPKLDREKDVL